MRSKLLLIALSSAVAACSTVMHDQPAKGVAAVNVPVVTTADYVMDAQAPGGVLAPGEPQKLDGWFQGLGLGYGDTVYVDGAAGEAARRQVSAIAGRYGMLVSAGAPVTAGLVGPDMVRVVVSRRRASVPGCPNWSDPSQPNYENKMLPSFGCGVNSNIAMQIADPEDLVHGREGTAVIDTNAAVKAVQLYRSQPPTGQGGLKDIKGSQ
jgi:pilus assembly protein CpaD